MDENTVAVSPAMALTRTLAEHGVTVAGIRSRHVPQRARWAARGDALRVLLRRGVDLDGMAGLLGISLDTVRRWAAVLEIDLRARPSTSHMLPIAGLRNEDPRGPCANYLTCLDAHVRAYTGEGRHASCPKACRFWTAEEKIHPHAYASSGRANMEAA